METTLLTKNVCLLTDAEVRGIKYFAIICPRCKQVICSIAGTIIGFEAVCPNCGAELYTFNSIAVTELYKDWCLEGEPISKGKERYEKFFEETDFRELIHKLWKESQRIKEFKEKTGINNLWEFFFNEEVKP